MGAVPVQAQFAPPAEVAPRITRMCLWNADKDTWRTLGLKRDQVRRMDELRTLYPAVVNGQWGDDPEPGASLSPEVGTPLPDGVSDAIPSAQVGLTGELGAANASTPLRVGGLQEDLRAVLTLEQLLAWGRLCPVE